MAKTPNYTDEQVAELVEGYQAVVDQDENTRDAFIDSMAEKLGKKRRSIIAKLSNLKVYRAKTPVAKDGEPAVKKDVAANTLRELTGLKLVSAENLTKNDIKALIAYVTMVTAIPEETGETDEESDAAPAMIGD